MLLYQGLGSMTRAHPRASRLIPSQALSAVDDSMSSSRKVCLPLDIEKLPNCYIVLRPCGWLSKAALGSANVLSLGRCGCVTRKLATLFQALHSHPCCFRRFEETDVGGPEMWEHTPLQRVHCVLGRVQTPDTSPPRPRFRPTPGPEGRKFSWATQRISELEKDLDRSKKHVKVWNVLHLLL